MEATKIQTITENPAKAYRLYITTPELDKVFTAYRAECHLPKAPTSEDLRKADVMALARMMREGLI